MKRVNDLGGACEEARGMASVGGGWGWSWGRPVWSSIPLFSLLRILLLLLLLLLQLYPRAAHTHPLLLFSFCLPRSFAWVATKLPLSPPLPPTLSWPSSFPPPPFLGPTVVVQLLPPPAAVSLGGTAVCPGPRTRVQGEGGRRAEHPAPCPATGHPYRGWGSGGGGADAAAELDREILV